MSPAKTGRRARASDVLGLTAALSADAGFPFAMAEEIARRILKPLTSADLRKLRYGIDRHPVLGSKDRWVWIAPGNVPDPIVLALHAARVRKAYLTLKLSRKLIRTGRILVRLLGRGLSVKLITAPSDLGADPEAAWIVYGSDATLRTLKAGRRTGAAWVGHGEKFSLSVVLRSASGSLSAARRCARDIWLYDQRGCLSPQVVWVQGSPSAAKTFGKNLQRELLGLWCQHGPVRRDPEAALARRAVLDDLTVRALDARKLEWLTAQDEVYAGSPAVYWLKRGPWPTSATGQVVGVKSFGAVSEFIRAIKPFWRQLQGVAIAGGPRERRIVEHALAGSGVAYIAAAGRLQTPPVVWNL